MRSRTPIDKSSLIAEMWAQMDSLTRRGTEDDCFTILTNEKFKDFRGFVWVKRKIWTSGLHIKLLCCVPITMSNIIHKGTLKCISLKEFIIKDVFSEEFIPELQQIISALVDQVSCLFHAEEPFSLLWGRRLGLRVRTRLWVNKMGFDAHFNKETI